MGRISESARRTAVYFGLTEPSAEDAEAAEDPTLAWFVNFAFMLLVAHIVARLLGVHERFVPTLAVSLGVALAWGLVARAVRAWWRGSSSDETAT